MTMNHHSDDDFVARLRDSAHAAVPASTLDLDDVLRTSRRKHTARRASVTLASTLALATAGAGAAGALPGIPGLWSSAPVEVSPSAEPPSILEEGVDVEPPAPSPTDLPSAAPEAEAVYLVPGVQSVVRPATYRVDADTVVLDLGLPAGGGTRYLAVVTLAKIDGRHSATDLELLAGGDTALQNLRQGNLGGTLLWRGVTSDAMVLPADGGPALVFGFSSAATEGCSTWSSTTRRPMVPRARRGRPRHRTPARPGPARRCRSRRSTCSATAACGCGCCRWTARPPSRAVSCTPRRAPGAPPGAVARRRSARSSTTSPRTR
nr:hypothetical protein GCM10025730_33190 [Promicromonospora thailandica]